MLTVVAASRNDGHGIHALERTQAFINGLEDQAKRFSRRVELILVEWNPPSDKVPLSEALTVGDGQLLSVRIVTVPPELHYGLQGPERLPFFQMIAKNVGIRRATGDAVLATNIDILLSDALFLDSTAPLNDYTVYRADRVDLPFDPHTGLDPARLRQQKPIRASRRQGLELPGRGIAEPHMTDGWTVLQTALTRPGSLLQKAFGPSIHNGPPGLPRIRRGFLKVFVLPNVHGNASGDFTLMTVRSWGGLLGYPEWVMHSWNLDSLLLYQAACAGYTTVNFAHPLYHLEHSGGWAPDADVKLFAGLIRDGVTFLPTEGLIDVARIMWKGRKRRQWRTNLASWGFADHFLRESSVRVRGDGTSPGDPGGGRT